MLDADGSRAGRCDDCYLSKVTESVLNPYID